ncbi:diguanylate cyclase domain-containing protein [Tepidamorphus sp. 3E244]|uniref:diguanylate cyclase domain-containing protein n=1 Tax=Tepidamorphus sp. 3E244 TaxID=3385498 RepID=UPI0038FCF2BB
MRAARVLVVGETIAGAEETAAVLRARGFDTAASSSETAIAELLASRRPDVVLFENPAGEKPANDNYEAFASAIRDTKLWADLPFIILGDEACELLPGDAALLVDRLGDDALPAELDFRIKSVARLAVMRSELSRRSRTLERMGLPVPRSVSPPAFVPEPNILIIGAGRGALKVQNAHGDGPKYFGAPTVNLALDALEKNQIDAVAIDATNDTEQAVEALSALRRIATWTTIPAIAITSDNSSGLELHEAGASDVLPLSCEDERIVTRMHLLVREQRYASAIQAVFRDTRNLPRDPDCPLASREFALAHLIDLVDGCDRHGDALSIVAVSVAGAGASKVASAFGGALAKMVRGEDLAARVGEGFFIIMLPSTDLMMAERVRDRISRVVSATDFGRDDDGKLVISDVSYSVQSYKPGDTSDSLLARTLDRLG